MNKGDRGRHDFNCWAASTVIIILKYTIVCKAVINITLRGIYLWSTDNYYNCSP